MMKNDYQAIRAFWEENVDALDGGRLPDSVCFGVRMCGGIVDDLYERICDLNASDITDGKPCFIETLNRRQLLGCIGYHFRALHFDGQHFEDPEMVYSLQRYVRAWLACPLD